MREAPEQTVTAPGWPAQRRLAPGVGILLGVIALVAAAGPAPGRAVAPGAARAPDDRALAARQGTLTFGSSLAHSPDAEVNFPNDTSVRNLALAGGGLVRAPAAGKITQLRLRGYAREARRRRVRKPLIEFQDLRPGAHGSVRVIVTTQSFRMPGADGVHRFRPINFFVRAGDYIGFSDNGGAQYSPGGVHFYVLSQVAGSQVGVFTGRGRDLNGARFTGRPRASTELLLQAVLRTGVKPPRAASR